MSDYITIKELSADIGVSEQALRQYCRKHEIRKETNSESNAKQAAYFLTENDVEQIKKHYAAKANNAKQDTKQSETKQQRNETKIVSFLEKEIEELKAQLSERDKTIEGLREQQRSISSLRSQIETRDNIIKDLKADKVQLNERLNSAEAERKDFLNNISELTIALKAAQALHGMDKQQAAIEVKETEENQEDQPRKTSFFSRLFRRTK